MKKTIAVLPGDGIGPEVTAEAVRVLEKVARARGCDFAFDEHDIGGAAIDSRGEALPAETLAAAKAADAVLLGAVGGAKWDSLPAEKRPERGALLPLRAGLGVYCNLRPAKVWKGLEEASPLKKEIVCGGIDLLVVRELTGGIYFGEHKTSSDGRDASDLMAYSTGEIERVARIAFASAKTRRGTVASVDKANVLATSRLWRATVERVWREEFPETSLRHLYVDNAAMQLVRDPASFDVILTENMFGDILSDEASQISGSIGMLPSASVRGDGFGLYEPIHGSAPDIAGRGIANPLAAILSAAMMLRHSFGMDGEAAAVEKACEQAIGEGLRTADLGGRASTREAADAVLANLEKNLG